MRLTVHHTVEELESWSRTESDADVASRVLMVLHARKGWSAEQIAEAVAKSRRTVQEWVRRYNAEGAAGLRDREGRGREPALSEEHAQRLRERLDAGPRDSDGVCTLRGLDVQRILEQEFGVLRALPSVYWLLHRLGYSCLMPRSKHRKADPQAPEEFKKNSPA